MKFSIKDFFSKCDKIRSFLQMATLQCTQPTPVVHDTFTTLKLTFKYSSFTSNLASQAYSGPCQTTMMQLFNRKQLTVFSS